jgi:hypothetical protein
MVSGHGAPAPAAGIPSAPAKPEQGERAHSQPVPPSVLIFRDNLLLWRAKRAATVFSWRAGLVL